MTAEPSTDGSIQLDKVEVRTPAGVRLIDPIDVRLDAGQSLVISGTSGSGKTTLLRSLAQLWPFTSGTSAPPAGRHHVPVAAALHAVGESAQGGLLPRRGRRVLRRRDPVGPGNGRPRASGRPAGRGERLGEGAVARRAAARRVRPGAADETEGGLPRRGDLGDRRRPGVRAIPRAARAAAGLHRGQRQPPPDPRPAPRPPARTTRRRRRGGSNRSSAGPRGCLRGGRRTSPRPTGCRWSSPCRPGRCWTRRHPRRTDRGSRRRPHPAPRRRR